MVRIAPSPNSRAAGFTLIEVLIALSVFAVGVLGVISMQGTSTGGNAKARYLVEAATWGADRLETLMNLAYNDPALADTDSDGTAGLDDATAATADGSATSTDGNYTIYWNVAGDTPVASTKTIRVIVTSPQLNNPVTLEFIKSDAI